MADGLDTSPAMDNAPSGSAARDPRKTGEPVPAAPVPASFFDDLERVYSRVLGPTDGPLLWAHEGPTIINTLKRIARELAGQYRLVKPLSMGGAGIVCLVENLGLSSPAFLGAGAEPTQSVLKLPRPVIGQVEILNRIIYGEMTKLLQLNHQNLVRIEYAGREPEGTYFYVMQKLDRPEDADDAVRASPTIQNLMRILRGALLGIQHLHHNGIAHLDIKPGNIFATDSQTVVGDLGFAKSVETPGITTNVGGTRGFQHPEHRDLILEARQSEIDMEDPNRLMSLSEVYRQRIRKEWDLYSLGVTTLVLLSVTSARDATVADAYEFRYLKLMAYRMLGSRVQYASDNTTDVRQLFPELAKTPLVSSSYLGIPANAFAGVAYTSIDEVVEDFLKLTGESDITRLVPELAEFQSQTIQASSLAAVPFSPRMRALVDTREVAALADVDQLGLVKLLYPVATHSRMEHSLGTTALAAKYTRALVADPLSPIFRQLISAKHAEALLLAALTHDIGHYPLAHDLEEVDPDIFHHELRTAHLLALPESKVREQIESGNWDATVEDVLAVLEKPESAGEVDSSPLQTQVLRSIIDGPIDADKVDYLIRDSENLRLPYGKGVDVDKLIATLTVVVSSDGRNTEARIGIQEKGRIPAESVAFARYSMFGSVYWHKTHRVLKAMLNRIAMEALAAAKTSHGDAYKEVLRTELYNLLGETSEELFTLPTGMAEERLSTSRLDAMSQLIVLWLATRAGMGKANVPGSVGEYRKLAIRLLERKHYKRILAISRVRPENQARQWTKVDQLFGNTRDTWQQRRMASIGLQSRVARATANWIASDGRESDPEIARLADEFIRRHDANAPLLILDSPPAERVGSRRPLEILHEPYWVADSRAELSVSAIEDSSVWSALAESYPKSLGKLRVFCEPNFAPLIAAVATREELEQMVWDAVTKDSRI